MCNKPNFFIERSPIWFVNLGMPTASYDDPKLIKPYRRIAAAALQHAKFSSSITIDSIQAFLDDSDILKAGNSQKNAEELGIAVIPETAANMTAFTKSVRSAPNLYLLIDVGAMTLDACMFRLNKKLEQGELYSFMAAQVRPLGVESFHWFIQEGKTESGFKKQCNRMLWETIWSTKKDRDPRAGNWKKGGDLPVFLVGGGAKNVLHLDIVNSLNGWLKEHTPNDGIRLLDLLIPRTIELTDKLENFGRMTVAWGLSYPPTEIGEIMPMSEISDIPRSTAIDFGDKYVAKDQV